VVVGFNDEGSMCSLQLFGKAADRSKQSVDYSNPSGG